ncbi:Rossmann-like domain-containing protein [Propionibacterium sp.]|uniref:Rossmann-like domain-containing protein n=1 Tax=Propionibacterium sp. TaxID=1977903 RepID=UPI0039ECF1BF
MNLYEELINGLPEECEVTDVLVGDGTVLVSSTVGTGLAPLIRQTGRPPVSVHRSIGMPLRDLASGVLSWNLKEASIGLAALCSYYNAPAVAAAHGVSLDRSSHSNNRLADPFISYQQFARGKTVRVVGHFHYLAQLYEPVCDLAVLEFEPQEGDYPLYAAEWLLPGADLVMLNTATIPFKVLPRLLELAGGALVVLVGPGVPLAPTLNGHGIDDLSGFVVIDPGRARQLVSGQDEARFSACGQKVSLRFAREESGGAYQLA